MADIKDDTEFTDVIKILKGLQRVEASSSFEMDLRRRINSEDYKGNKQSFLKLLTPARIIPSAALAAAAIMMFFFLNIETPQFDDPLSVEPQLREDVISGTSADELILQKLQRKATDNLRASSNVSFIAKSGLNFRQINLSESEKIKLQHLKEKFKSWFRSRE